MNVKINNNKKCPVCGKRMRYNYDKHRMECKCGFINIQKDISSYWKVKIKFNKELKNH